MMCYPYYNETMVVKVYESNMEEIPIRRGVSNDVFCHVYCSATFSDKKPYLKGRKA